MQEYRFNGGTAYRIKICTLPSLRNNVYAITGGKTDGITLIDAGFGKKSATLINKEVRRISLKTKKRLSNIIITHSHIDHFGAIKSIKGNFRAHAFHPDDTTIKHFRENFQHYEEKLRRFLKKSGAPFFTTYKIRLMYKMHKVLFNRYEINELTEIRGIKIIHTPGHSPGHVCIGIGNALFTGDHILPDITPIQSPSYLTPGCGLENYIASLKKISGMNYNIAFPAHGEPFHHIGKRINEIIKFHNERLNTIEKRCNGKTLYETAYSVFGSRMKGYHTFLALLETAAHLEYLENKKRIIKTGDKYFVAPAKN